MSQSHSHLGVTVYQSRWSPPHHEWWLDTMHTSTSVGWPATGDFNRQPIIGYCQMLYSPGWLFIIENFYAYIVSTAYQKTATNPFLNALELLGLLHKASNIHEHTHTYIIVQCHYNMANFSQIPHNRHPILNYQGYICLSLGSSISDLCPYHSMQCYMQYNVILDCVITAPKYYRYTCVW